MTVSTGFTVSLPLVPTQPDDETTGHPHFILAGRGGYDVLLYILWGDKNYIEIERELGV